MELVCRNCVLTTREDVALTLDENGVCNYCRDYMHRYVINGKSAEEKTRELKNVVNKIKKEASGKYDSIMGLSGGVDSSYLAWWAKKLGLNPLVVHFDNGWNTELAVQNIQGIIEKTGFDLYTYVVDWEEFKDLQLAYIKSGVLDWEVPTDHGFYACLFHQAYKHKIKYILTGHNYQTEAILPKAMRWSKMDVDNLLDIHKKFGTRKLKTFPILDFYTFSWYQLVLKFKRVNILEYVDYNKAKAKETIKKEFGWRDYGGKHYESIFTRFYQGYILKEKYGFDKRRAHLSNLILSGQITREEALKELEKPPYDPHLLKEDFEFVAKKFDMTPEQFRELIEKTPVRSHLEFKSYETGIYRKHEKVMKAIKPFTKAFKKILNKN
ncbi:MAG: N-acetyl sugar amidotransferase [Bacteroidia bacterium]|nr:N-acetyl sugar amidotransferase [Bacteroidia bacterium]